VAIVPDDGAGGAYCLEREVTPTSALLNEGTMPGVTARRRAPVSDYHLPTLDGEHHRRIHPARVRLLLAAGDLRRAFAAALCALVPRRTQRSSCVRRPR
jgi:hypothetical protein